MLKHSGTQGVTENAWPEGSQVFLELRVRKCPPVAYLRAQPRLQEKALEGALGWPKMVRPPHGAARAGLYSGQGDMYQKVPSLLGLDALERALALSQQGS